ncbi:MAG: hypothetical protein ABI237_18760 [Ginsengibacter sp.]
MNIQFRDLIPQSFNDNSRVWIYQSNRMFSVKEAVELEEQLEDFAKEWNSHGSAVKSYANLFFGHFIIFIADESIVKVGGCSTDSSVRFIKNVQQDFNVNLLDRQLLAFIVKEKIQLVPLTQVNASIESGFITPDTLYFNNTILSKKELLHNWIIPVKHSWLANRIPDSHLK